MELTSLNLCTSCCQHSCTCLTWNTYSSRTKIYFFPFQTFQKSEAEKSMTGLRSEGCVCAEKPLHGLGLSWGNLPATLEVSSPKWMLSRESITPCFPTLGTQRRTALDRALCAVTIRLSSPQHHAGKQPWHDSFDFRLT